MCTTIITFMALTVAAPLAAQSTIPGLENFTLERPQPPRPTPVPTGTPVPPPSPTPTATTAPTVRPTATPEPRATPRPRPAATTPAATPSPVTTPAPIGSEPAVPPETTPAPAATQTPEETPPPVVVPEPATTTGTNWTLWAGLAAALLIALAGFAWWRSRSNGDVEFETASFDEGGEFSTDEVEREPEPVRAPPARTTAAPARSTDRSITPAEPPAPPPPPPPSLAGGLVTSSRPGGLVTSSLKPGGLITSALMPELRITLSPLRGGVDTLRATLEYELQLGNVGRGAARAVAVEAWLISAGHETAAHLATLFAQPPGEPMLPPFDLPGNAAIDLPAVATTPRDALAIITAGDRRSFVPVLAVRVSYIDGRASPQVLNAAYLVGVTRAGQERLAPLPLDRGARMHEQLAARPFGS